MMPNASLDDRLMGKDPLRARSVHMIGVCGTGMGALARLLKSRGYKVTGSDESVYPPMSDFLKEWGVPVREGFKASNLVPEPDLVVVGNVVSRNHEEAKALLEKRIPYLSFPEAVNLFFLQGKKPVVVCGTHGKTTTTGILAWVFHFSGKEPGFFFGGILKEMNVSSCYGEGECFVIEGDEYDTAFFDARAKFVHYDPEIAIVNGIEFDHADLYKDFDEMKRAFSMLLDARRDNGWILYHGDDPCCREIFGQAGQTETFGFENRNHWVAKKLIPHPEGVVYELFFQSESKGEVFLPLWGRHNVLNSLAVFAAGTRAGLTIEEIKNGLKTFPGMKRRQEIFYSENDVVMIDDFAHHPTAVRETIAAVREHNPDSFLLAVYEPRSNTSRSDIFQKDYERVFDQADEILLYKPIQKNTRLLKGSPFLDIECLSKKIREKTPCRALTDKGRLFKAATERILSRESGQKMIVLIMSNGKFEGIYKALPEMIQDEKAGVS